jgi:hypothetical protein
MIKSQSLEYACHGYGTRPGMTIADLDRDAATIGQAHRVNRLCARLPDETWDCAVQFGLVPPGA